MSDNPPLDTLAANTSQDRVILVGQMPSGNEPDAPLSAQDARWSGGRLARMCGLTPDQFESAFHRVNVCYQRETKFATNEIGRARARRVNTAFRKGDEVVILGSAVEKCFYGLTPRRWRFNDGHVKHGDFDNHSRGIEWHVIPHPSGLNRYYNDPTNVRIVGEFLRSLVESRL